MTDATFTIGAQDQTAAGWKSAEKTAKKSSESIKSSLDSALNFARGGAIGYGIMQVTSGISAMVDTALDMNKIEARFSAATDSVAEMNEAMERAQKVSSDYSLRYKDVAGSMAMFEASVKGTASAGEDAQSIIRGVAAASTALSLSADEASGIYRAFGQIISKGTVQAEEWKGQIGDRLPGAMQLGAQAMNMSLEQFSKAMEQGKIKSTEFIAAVGPALENMYSDKAKERNDSLQADLNAIGTWWDELKAKMAGGIQPVIHAVRMSVDKTDEAKKFQTTGNAAAFAAVADSGGFGLQAISESAKEATNNSIALRKAIDEVNKSMGLSVNYADEFANDILSEYEVTATPPDMKDYYKNLRAADEARKKELDSMNKATMTALEKDYAEYTEYMEKLNKLYASGAISKYQYGDRAAEAPNKSMYDGSNARQIKAAEDYASVNNAILDDVDRRTEESLNTFSTAVAVEIPESVRVSFSQTANYIEQIHSTLYNSFHDLFMSIGTGADNFAESLINSFKSILADAATRKLFEMLTQTGSSMSGSDNSWIKAIGSGIMSLFSANGNAFNSSGRVTAFANGGVFGTPTAFQYGNGRLGVMGEAGAEAVMPLARDSSGKLGVKASGSQGGTINYAPSFTINGSGLSQAQLVAAMNQASDASVARVMEMKRRGQF